MPSGVRISSYLPRGKPQADADLKAAEEKASAEEEAVKKEVANPTAPTAKVEVPEVYVAKEIAPDRHAARMLEDPEYARIMHERARASAIDPVAEDAKVAEEARIEAARVEAARAAEETAPVS